jgi:hypothetical protein
MDEGGDQGYRDRKELFLVWAEDFVTANIF